MKKVIFLDRDGVINRFPGNGNYVTKVKDFHFLPGALEALRELTKKGYVIFVVSNQAGVGKGIFSKRKLDQITKKMLREVRRHGGKIRRVYYSISRSDEGCEYRKPNIGSIKEAMRILRKRLSYARNAVFVGDTEVDVQTGHNVGCKTIFVLSGRENHEYLERKWKVRPHFIARDLREAARIIDDLHENPRMKRKRLSHLTTLRAEG